VFLGLDLLESRVMLDATPTLQVGAGSIFTQLPPVPYPPTPNAPAAPYLTPSDQTVVLDNIVTEDANGNYHPADVSNAQVPPDIAPGSPASTEPVETNRGWSLALTRSPTLIEYLLNSQAFSISTDGTKLLPYSGPDPNAPYFGKKILQTGPNSYKYVGDAGIVSTYAPNTGNPNTFGPLSFRTNLALNASSDGNGFGLPNVPFSSTPTELFSLESTAEYLDYRPNLGNPNGSQTVTVQELDQNGVWQNVQTNGLIPDYVYDLPASTTTATNSFSIPNSPDLSVTVMDLSHQNANGTFQDPTGVDAGNLQVISTSDYASTLGWGNAQTGSFQVTMASGDPFAQFTLTPGNATTDQQTLVIRNQDITGFTTEPIQDTATVYPALNAIEITGYGQPNTSGMQVITDPATNPKANPNLKVKVFYAVYFPAGTPLNTLQSIADGLDYLPATPTSLVTNPLFGQAANNILINLPSGVSSVKPFQFVIAALPNDSASTVTQFQHYAFNYVTNTQGNFSYNPATNAVSLTLSATTKNVDPQSTAADGTLFVTYPNQYKFLDPNTYNSLYLTDPNLPGSYLEMPSLYGTSRFLAPPTIVNNDGTATSSMSYSLPYQGSLSILPAGAFVSTSMGDTPSATPAELNSEIQLIENQFVDLNPTDYLQLNGEGNTYVWGQELNALATLIPIADQLGLSPQRDQLLQLLESELTQWFNASTTLNSGQSFGYNTSTGINQFLYYDQTWNAIIGYAAGFGTDTALADEQYTWGYWVQAASVIATYDPSFTASYGPVINLLIQNVANWDRTSTMFPYLRVFNPYDGHSWAAGVYPVGDANNEESASEAINFYSAMIDWGNLEMAAAPTQNPSDSTYATGLAIRNMGISLETFEIESYEQYWVNVDGDTFPQLTRVTYGGNTYYAGGYIQRYSYAGLNGTTDVNPPSQWQDETYASNQFLLKRGTQTFFVGNDPTKSNNAESQLAITVLPFTPASLYLGRDVNYTTAPTNGNPSMVVNIPQELYNRYIAQQNAIYGTPVQGQLRSIPENYTGDILIYQSLFDPQGALDRWNGIGNYRYDYPATATPAQLAGDNYTNYTFNVPEETQAGTYYFMQFFNKYGEVNGSVYATNATATAVLDQPQAMGSGQSVRTYVVDNLQSTPMAAVDFTDGYILENTPARSVYAVTVTRNASGQIVSSVTNTYTIPNLSGAGASPPTGGGTNLYLGYSTTAPPPTPANGTIEPLSTSPPTSSGLIPITAPFPDGSAQTTSNYPYNTPYVRSDGGPSQFIGSTLPSNTTAVSWQISHVSGSYIPGQDTSFQLVFQAPLGQINPPSNINPNGLPGSVILITAQVIYQLNDAQNTEYVETYPMANYSFIGGIVTYTSSTLGTGPTGTMVPGNPLWSGVVAATRTVGQGQTDPNTHFDVYDTSVAGNMNLLDPANAAQDTKLSQIRDRRVQFSAQPLTMVNGTVTLVVYISQFSKNSTNFTNPVIQFVPGLPSYAGLQSFVSIPFKSTRFGATPTSATFTSVSSNAIIDRGLDIAPLSATVTADGLPVNEGLVQFLENGITSLGFAPVVQGIATLTPNQFLAAGFDTITALYSDAAGGFEPSVAGAEVVEVDTAIVNNTGLKVVEPNGATRFQVDPFGANDHGGLNVVGLEPGNGLNPELVVAPRHGGKSKIRLYDAVTGKTIRSINAFPSTFQGGVSVAAVSFNGGASIVAAAGRGGVPKIKVFNALTGRPLLSFLAFDRRYRNGTNVSVAESPGGAGFSITAQTTWRGRTYTNVFNGTNGAQISGTVVPKVKTSSSLIAGHPDVQVEAGKSRDRRLTPPHHGSGITRTTRRI
jgi:hypothetical protein